MMTYDTIRRALPGSPRCWLVTGAAGFIGSNLVMELLRRGQWVVGIDNLLTGFLRNLDEVRLEVGSDAWRRFTWIHGDITDAETCRNACDGIEIVLHQAALGSVPRSISNPDATNHHNVTGFVTVLNAAKAAGVRRFVYASSSSVYGNDPSLPKTEERLGECLSPYAVTKRINELYASVFSRCYGVNCIGLRYFNVFGARQSPDGPYAAVIPRWISSMLTGEQVVIHGDGQTSRDFCYVDNVVQANLLAALVEDPEALDTVYNISAGGCTSLNALYEMLKIRLVRERPDLVDATPLYDDFRPGDVRHSHADISKAGRLLGYHPTHRIEDGLNAALDWYVRRLLHA